MHTEQIARSHRPEFRFEDLACEEQCLSTLPGRISRRRNTPPCPGARCPSHRSEKTSPRSTRSHRFAGDPGHSQDAKSPDAYHAIAVGSSHPCTSTRGYTKGSRAPCSNISTIIIAAATNDSLVGQSQLLCTFLQRLLFQRGLKVRGNGQDVLMGSK